MPNPDPARITEEMWKLWVLCTIPGVKFGGIYADKPGYHNTVLRNQQKWPNNYSVQLDLDLVKVNRDKARAIDLTMSDSEMVLWTNRMKKSAEDPRDHRLAAVKEFYGTLDNKTVYGLKKNDTNGTWSRTSADSSHLWHGHVSIFTVFVANWLMLAPLLSVWRGETVEDWINVVALPKKGDHGEDVRYWQLIHNAIAPTFKPPLINVTADGDYGPSTQNAIHQFWQNVGGTGKYDGSYLHAWTAVQYQMAFIGLHSKPYVPSPTDPEKIKELVNTWLKENVAANLNVAGELKGKVSLL